MCGPLSMDLHVWLLAAVDNGTSRCAVAARFGIAPSTATRSGAARRHLSTRRVNQLPQVVQNGPD